MPILVLGLAACQPAKIDSPPLDPELETVTLEDAHEKIEDRGLFGNPGRVETLISEGRCQVKIDFGSRATGIPRRHALAAQNWLVNSPDVTKIYRIYWGLEGEITFCAAVPNENKRAVIAGGLNKAVSKLGQPKNGYYGKATVEAAR